MIPPYIASGGRFELHDEEPRYLRSSKNLMSALQNTAIVNKKLQEALEAHRIMEPYVTLLHSLSIISKFTLSVWFKKKNGQFRLIYHISFPDKSSIDDFIQYFFIEPNLLL